MKRNRFRLITAMVCLLMSTIAYADKNTFEIRRALAKPIASVKIQGNLSKALSTFTRKTGVIVIADWKTLKASGISSKKKVSAKLNKVSGIQLLDYILAQVSAGKEPLAWNIQKGVIFVTTQEHLLNSSKEQHVIGRLLNSRPAPKLAAMSKRPSFDFDETELNSVIDVIGTKTKASIYVNWRALEKVGVTRDTPVTLKLKGVKLATALELLTDQLSVGHNRLESVYWVVDDGMIKISTGTNLNRKLKNVTFDVADLLHVVRNFKASNLTLKTPMPGEDSKESPKDEARADQNTPPEEVPTRRDLEQSLSNIIRNAIGQEMWAPQGKGQIHFYNSKMIISQTDLGFKLLERSLRGL